MGLCMYYVFNNINLCLMRTYRTDRLLDGHNGPHVGIYYDSLCLLKTYLAQVYYCTGIMGLYACI